MGKFRFTGTKISGLMVVEPTVFGDSRGFFMETYHRRDFFEAGIDAEFVQDNHSRSRRGVLRGLHFQVNRPQGKLVRVLSGEVFDVAVDIRKGSDTFGQWEGVALSAENKRQFYIPEGFAHGFYVLSETADFFYKCTRFFDAADELGIRFDDDDIGIDWPVPATEDPLISEKDLALPSFDEVCLKLGL